MRDVQDAGTGLVPADMMELARQLHILRISLDGELLTEGQQADMETLAIAQIAAERGHAAGASSHLAAVGTWAVQAAIDVDALMAARAISAGRAEAHGVVRLDGRPV